VLRARAKVALSPAPVRSGGELLAVHSRSRTRTDPTAMLQSAGRPSSADPGRLSVSLSLSAGAAPRPNATHCRDHRRGDVAFDLREWRSKPRRRPRGWRARSAVPIGDTAVDDAQSFRFTDLSAIAISRFRRGRARTSRRSPRNWMIAKYLAGSANHRATARDSELDAPTRVRLPPDRFCWRLRRLVRRLQSSVSTSSSRRISSRRRLADPSAATTSPPRLGWSPLAHSGHRFNDLIARSRPRGVTCAACASVVPDLTDGQHSPRGATAGAAGCHHKSTPVSLCL